MNGADVDTGTAPGAGGEKCQLRPGTWGTKITCRGDPALGSRSHFPGQLREGLPEEVPPFRLVQS